jgi:AAA15 family ATPase/GTPase
MGDNNHCTAEGFMLRELTIQNYRCFKDFYIDGLARVNLIVGMNNSGKTSLLEAVYLLVDQANPQCLLEILHDRGEIAPLGGDRRAIAPSYQLSHIFHGHQLDLDQIIYIKSYKDQPLSLKIQLCRVIQQSQFFEDTGEINVPAFELVLTYEPDLQIKAPILQDGSVQRRFFRTENSSQPYFTSSAQQCHFLTTEHVGFDQLATLWDRITLTPKEESLVKALQILEPDVERMSFTSNQTHNSGILLKLRGHHRPIPLGSMGDGMRRILNLGMVAVTAENSVLLVDEIETGLYYESQTDMWRLVLEVAQQLNVQVFATTHSWDCISAFHEALDQLEDSSVGKLFRLSRKGDNIHAVDYPAEKLGVAVRQNIEVR